MDTWPVSACASGPSEQNNNTQTHFHPNKSEIARYFLIFKLFSFFSRKVLPHEAETAGAIMAFFLALGLALGAALSFVFRALV